MEEVVRAAQQGDGAAMVRLMRELMPMVGRVCGAIALDDGDDAMQETMIAVLRHIGSLREPAAVYGWARQVATREALRLVRRRPPSTPSDHLDTLPAVGPDPATTVDVVATLRRLTPDQRAILVLRDLEGLTEAEAARALHVELGTVKSRLNRARRAFRERWER